MRFIIGRRSCHGYDRSRTCVTGRQNNNMSSGIIQTEHISLHMGPMGLNGRTIASPSWVYVWYVLVCMYIHAALLRSCLSPNLRGVKGALTKQQLPLEIHFILHQVDDKLCRKYRTKKNSKAKKLTWQEDRRARYSPTTQQQYDLFTRESPLWYV